MERMASDLGLGRPEHVEHLAGGLGSTPLAVTFRDHRLVVKRFGVNFEAARREHANLMVARDAAVATPEPMYLDAGGEWFGEVALAMSYIQGEPGFPRAEAGRWVEDLATALVRVHDVPVVASEGQRPDRLFAWIRTKALDDDRLHRVEHVCRTFVDREKVVFSHGDYHPGNVLFCEGSIAGVVDWLDAGSRSRASDVAYCRSVLAVYPDGELPDLFLAAYQAESGRPVDCRAWDAIWGARGLRGAHGRWPEAFAALGVTLSPADIWDRSAVWVDAALAEAGT